MAALGLQVIEPVNDTAFAGSPTVAFRGMLTAVPPELVGAPIYYRWYSSLHPAEHEHYSMSPPLTDAETAFSGALGIGSHAITFAASDRSGETDSDLKAMQHGGVTGGLEGDNRCVIHIFKANILAPLGGSVSRTGIVLEAEAPPAWAKSVNNGSSRPGSRPARRTHCGARWRRGNARAASATARSGSSAACASVATPRCSPGRSSCRSRASANTASPNRTPPASRCWMYVSAWLKCHEPAAFACALLNSQPMGFYAPAQIVQDARRHGVEVRPADVLAREGDCWY